MSAGERISSPDSQFRAEMQHDGNFVVYGANGAVWQSGTGGTGDGASVVLQDDGNLVVYRAGGVATFSSDTAPSRGNTLVMQNDGNLVIYSSGGLPLWSSRGGRTPNREDVLAAGSVLNTGQSVRSRNGSYTAIMQSDGNFVVYGPNGATWSTGTGGVGPGVVAIMQTDGNLVLYAPGGRAIYSSGTAPSSGAQLAMQDDGNLVIYGSGGALWAKGQILTSASALPSPFPCTARSNACVAYTGFNPNVSVWGQDVNPLGNCTNYAAYSLSRRGATRLSGSGNASTWRQRTVNQFGAARVNGTPAVGSIAWWGYGIGPSGHVAVVERVEGGRVWITESSYNIGSGRRVLTPGTAEYPAAFLHIAPGT
ncbi:CHAP domain-containing protein [Nocardioides scoriae]|uniref:CHAP domain-containing protein n=2 Tax=Nocardioides scoriae TaxID=642780 RepID=A0A1H1QBF0_9ACTN|nr:CHAP domain-containing protein [Nocardioides scoriae]